MNSQWIFFAEKNTDINLLLGSSKKLNVTQALNKCDTTSNQSPNHREAALDKYQQDVL